MHKHWMEYSEMHSLEEDCLYTCQYEECMRYYGECPKMEGMIYEYL